MVVAPTPLAQAVGAAHRRSKEVGAGAAILLVQAAAAAGVVRRLAGAEEAACSMEEAGVAVPLSAAAAQA